MENTAGGEADFHEGADAEEEHARQSGIKNGKLDPGQGIQPHQPPIRCPEYLAKYVTVSAKIDVELD
jgi:hypothetical protein